MNIKLTAIFHYPTIDTECSGNYFSIDLLHDDVLVHTFRDDYYDSGQDKLKKHIHGVEFLSCRKVKLLITHKNDIEI